MIGNTKEMPRLGASWILAKELEVIKARRR